MQQGQTCCVTEAHLDELTGEHTAQYVLDLAEHRSPAGKASAEGVKAEDVQGPGHELDRHCLLEVVRQDAFLGFRAPAASWRYMQPRRKAPHRLVFFNLNLGIWEQWEVASGDPWSQPWTSLHLVLRSRRLPNITLDLQVQRVGKYGASPIAHAPPSRGLAAGSDAADHISSTTTSPPHAVSAVGSRRSTAGSPPTGAPGVAGGGGGARKMLQFANELGEDEHLRRISSMLVQEWVRFVDVEKALRAEVEEQVVALVEEMAQLKMDTIGQVEFLRSEMNSEIIGLFDLAQMREFQLQQARAVRRRVLAVVVAAQWRRKAYHVMQLVMEGWLKVGTRKTRLAQARCRADHRTLGKSFDAWVVYTAARGARARLLIRGVMATSRRVMQRVMEGWREVTHCHALGRQQLLVLANRADAALLADAFEEWQLACIPHAPLWGQAVRMHARMEQRKVGGMLLGWWAVGRGKQALRAVGAKCARRSRDCLLRAALHKWAEVVDEGQRLRAVGAAVKERSDARLRYAAVTAWYQRTQRSAVVARKLNAHLAKRQRACQAKAMEGWQGILCDARAARAKLRRAQRRRDTRLQHAAWYSWVEVAAHKAIQRRRVARSRQALSQRMLSAAMSALWEKVRLARAGRRVLHKWTQGTLLHTFQAWVSVCVRSAQGAALLQSVARARSSSMLAAALQEWAWIARWHTAMRLHALDRLAEDTKSVMVLALGAWWLPVAAPTGTEGPHGASTAPAAAECGSQGRAGSAMSQPLVAHTHAHQPSSDAALGGSSAADSSCITCCVEGHSLTFALQGSGDGAGTGVSHSSGSGSSSSSSSSRGSSGAHAAPVEGSTADLNSDATPNEKASGGWDEERELRIAQARRGDQSAMQAKLQADQQKRDAELAKEEAEEEQRRREVEQGGSIATTIPLQAPHLPPAQGVAGQDGTSQVPGAAGRSESSEQGGAGQEGQQGGSGMGMASEGQQQQHEGNGAGAAEGQQGSPVAEGGVSHLLEEHEFKSPWWSKARDEEVEELLMQRRDERESEGEKQERLKREQEEKEQEEHKDSPGILSRGHVYEINRLQSAITEIANSGYIESVKQLRETLLIQEWDMSNRHLAKKRAISMFERYLVEFNLYEEAGGFEVIGALYEDPDAYVELLVSERLRGLARSMMEECMSERRMQVYQSCNATAKDIAMRELNGSGLTSIFSMKEGLWGVAQRLWSIVQRIVMPFKFW